MAIRGIEIWGVSAYISANRRALTLGWTVSNRLWRGAQRWLRHLFGQGAASVPMRPRGPVTEPVLSLLDQQSLVERVRDIDWYHSIDLGQGIVTPGKFDHRGILEEYRLPERLDGLRVLDIATWDGFWAFEFERRGAREVVATDIPFFNDLDCSSAVRARLERELPPEVRMERTGKGFELARAIRASSVSRHTLSVYDLSPERLGTFDVVHAGDLLLHLKHPLKALERIHSVTGGYAMISDCFWPELDLMGGECLMEYLGGTEDNVWWKFSLEALRRMILDAGFTSAELQNKFRYGFRNQATHLHHAVFRAYPGRTTASTGSKIR